MLESALGAVANTFSVSQSVISRCMELVPTYPKCCRSTSFRASLSRRHIANRPKWSTHRGNRGISIDVNKMWSFNPVAFVLFVVELYHILGHAAILFRVRLLPRKDLVRIRYYFLFDAASVFITCFLYTGRLKWLASLQILQHLYYFVTWNKSALANKIMDWSSLDYFKSHKKDRLELDSILGTAFDISVHVLNVYMLMSYLTTVGILLGLAVAHGSAYFILYNPRLAWSSPYKMPAWIERRIRPLQP